MEVILKDMGSYIFIEHYRLPLLYEADWSKRSLDSANPHALEMESIFCSLPFIEMYISWAPPNLFLATPILARQPVWKSENILSTT